MSPNNQIKPPGNEPADMSASLPACGEIAATKTSFRNDPFPDLKIVEIDLEEIEEASRRVRRVLPNHVAAVKRSMERYGNRVPVLVTGKDGSGNHVVIDGHHRVAAARELGADQVPCIVVDDLPQTEIRRLALSLNKLQENGAWDDDALRLEINEIIEMDDDLEIPGFDLPELEALQFGVSEESAPDPADVFDDPDPDAPCVSRAGDRFVLGDHVVLCGSARDGDALAALLENGPASVVLTDHPYNVPINGHVRSPSGGFAEFAEGSGEMSRSEFVDFLKETTGHAASSLKPGGILFLCMDWRHVGEMTEALETLGLPLLNICVWVKSNPGMGSLYRSQHELVFVAKKPGGPHCNNVELGRHGRNRSNVWHYAGKTGGQSDADDDFDAHPTVKPISLVMDALLDVSAPGDRVLDPFLGSGTTLLAAERTRRRCIGVEIEPRYVDVAIRRWQAMVGRTAWHATSGTSFDDLARERGAERGTKCASSATTLNPTEPTKEDF